MSRHLDNRFRQEAIFRCSPAIQGDNQEIPPVVTPAPPLDLAQLATSPPPMNGEKPKVVIPSYRVGQVNALQTVTIPFVGTAGSAVGVFARSGQHMFNEDTILIGVYMSVACTLDSAFTQTASGFVSRDQGATLSLPGANGEVNGVFLTMTFSIFGGIVTDVPFSKSAGAGFNPPFCPFFSGGTAIAAYSPDFLNLATEIFTGFATIYFVPYKFVF